MPVATGGTFEYSGDPATSTKDEVRFLIGDTDENDPQLSDEEIEYLLDKHGDVGAAASAACVQLAVSYGKLAVDVKVVGDLRIEYADRAARFSDLAKTVGSTVAGSNVPVPIMMGRTYSQKEAAAADADRIPTAFRIGQDDNPEISREVDDPRNYP